LQTVDFLLAVAFQELPVEARRAHLPAEAGTVAKGAGVFCGKTVELFRYATHVDAGAAEIALLGNGDARPQAGSGPGCAHTSRPGTHHKQIDFLHADFHSKCVKKIFTFLMSVYYYRREIRKRSHRRSST